MILTRKFYDADVNETGGGAETAVEETTTEQPPSIAALMAKSGIKNSSNEMVAAPIQISETKAETKTAKTETPAATANEEVKVEKVEPETPKPTEPKAETQKPPTEEAKQPEVKWQEVLKTQQPKAVLQALGFDEKMTDLVEGLKDLDPKVLGLLESYKNGTTKEYLRELSTDYSKMPAEDVMRHQLRLDYPKASDKQLDILYKKEIIEKYNLDSDDPDTVEEGQLLLDAKADKYRDDFVKTQEKYLLPKPSEEKAKEPVVSPEMERQKQVIESVTKQFQDDPYTQSLVKDNKFNIGEGEDKFGFPIDGKAVANLAINGDPEGELMFDKKVDANGNETFIPKAQHQLLVATVNKYGMSFIDELAKHYKALGGKKAIEPIENAKTVDTKNTSQSQAEPKTPAEAMARKGVLNSGGN